MKKIQNLVTLFDKSLNYSNNDWNKLKSGLSGITTELLEINQSNKEYDEDEIAHELLRTDSKDQNFIRINRKLYDDLINKIIETNFNSTKYSPYKKAFLVDSKLIAVLNILIGLSNKSVSFSLARKLHKRSVHYRFTENRLISSRFLHKYYSLYAPSRAKSEFYSKEIDESLRILKTEDELRKLQNAIGFNLNSKSEVSSSEIEHCIMLVKQFDEYKGIHSVKFHTIYYSLMNSLLAEKGDTDLSLANATEAITYLESLPFENDGSRSIFLFGLARVHLQRNEPKEARVHLLESLKYQAKKNQNTFLKQRLHYCIELRLGHYHSAEDIFNYLKTFKKEKQIDRESLEFLVKAEYLLAFYSFIGKFSPAKKFNRLKLESSLDLFKSQYGQPKLDLEVLDLLLSTVLKSKTRIRQVKEDNKEVLAKKLHKSNPNFRNICLLKMLSEVSECKYHPVAVERKTTAFLKRLTSDSDTTSPDVLEKEIIDYESLWDMVVEFLNK